MKPDHLHQSLDAWPAVRVPSRSYRLQFILYARVLLEGELYLLYFSGGVSLDHVHHVPTLLSWTAFPAETR